MAMTSSNQHESLTIDDEHYLTALNRNLPPRGWSPFYRLSVWVSATALLLLTCLYVSLVTLAAWVAFDYFLSHIRLLGTDVESITVLLYSIPPLLFLVVWALLIKPLFRWESPEPEPIIVSREDEPLLYEFVERICRSVGGRMVDQIQLVLGAQAAVYHEGPWGGIFSRKRVLVLGLPIVAGCNIAALAGIVAHEMGHLVQLRNVRLTDLIRIFNRWFYKAIYEPDRFDLWLAQQTFPGRMTRWLFIPVEYVLTLGRIVLWVFFILVEAASCMISRKEEYDCDQFMAQLVGSERAAEALRRVHVLEIAAEATLGDIEQSWQEKRLPDDITKIIIARAERFDSRQQEIWLKVVSQAANRWFDTHPSLPDRLRAIKQMNFPEAGQSEEPAALLLQDFDQRSRSLTIEFYQEILAQEFARESLVPAETLQQEYAADDNAQSTLRRYFQVEPLLVRPIFPEMAELAPVDNHEGISTGLAESRLRYLNGKEQIGKANERFLQIHRDLLDLRVEQCLATVDRINREEVSQRIESLTIQQKDAEKELDEYSSAARHRMTYALQLLKSSFGSAEGQYPELGEHAKKVDRVLTVCSPLSKLVYNLDELLAKSLALNVVVQNFDDKNIPRPYRRGVRSLVGSIHADLQAVCESFAGINYPFEHRDGVVSMEQFLIPKSPDSLERPELVILVGEVLQRTDFLVARVMASIAEACEQVENALGHPQQEDPLELDPWEQLDKELERNQPQEVNYSALGSNMAGALVAGIAVAMLVGVFQGGKRATNVVPHHPRYEPTVLPGDWGLQREADSSGWWNSSVAPGIQPPMPQSRQPQIPGTSVNRPGQPSGLVEGREPWKQNQPGNVSQPGHSPTPPVGGPNSQFRNSASQRARPPGIGGTPPYRPNPTPPTPNRPTPTSPSPLPRPGFP